MAGALWPPKTGQYNQWLTDSVHTADISNNNVLCATVKEGMLQRDRIQVKKRDIEESKDTNHELQVQCWAECLSTQGEDMAVEEGGVEQEEQHANKGEMGKEEAGKGGGGSRAGGENK